LKGKESDRPEEAGVLLSSCKFLDLLLTLAPEEFQWYVLNDISL